MSFELLLLGTIVLVAAASGLALVLALRPGTHSPLARALEEGRFAAVLGLAKSRALDEREDLLATAAAAKHLLRWSQAEELLQRLLGEDPADGEVLVEAGLVATYRQRAQEAEQLLSRAAAARADLSESVMLHRAFAALVAGQPQRARDLFEEVEAPLETKLEVDLGEGEALFAEWFLHAACLWGRLGRVERGRWAWEKGVESAPESLLPDFIRDQLRLAPDPHPPHEHSARPCSPSRSSGA